MGPILALGQSHREAVSARDQPQANDLSSLRMTGISVPRWRWLGFSGTVRAGIRPAIINSRFRIMQHGVAATHHVSVFLVDGQKIAHAGELVANFRRDTRFDVYMAAAVRVNGEARDFESLLDVHSIINDIRDELRVS